MATAVHIESSQIRLNGRPVPLAGNASSTAFYTYMDLAKCFLGEEAARSVLVVKVDHEIRDLYSGLFPAASPRSIIDFLTWDDREARSVFWHSSAHILGLILEREFGAMLTNGPPLAEGGFYYDVALPGGAFMTSADVARAQAAVDAALQQRARFERLELSREEALELFADNPFKVSFIKSKVSPGGVASVYRCGNLIDLCRGPHIPHTGFVKALAITKIGASYWLGDSKNAPLQRVFGMSFPSKRLLKEWQDFQEEAGKRDHRAIGKQQELFMFHHFSPGSAFFLPRGTAIHNKLTNYLRLEYRKRGYVEVITPNIFNKELWETSGHWENYKDNMFVISEKEEHVGHAHTLPGGQQFGLKPMNCPGHCLIFDSTQRSYKDLPIRLADFGVLHRNELSGALTGLTRVRRFQQDDAHIFCTVSQIRAEIGSALEFMKSVYGVFGFQDFSVALSTRPESNFMGNIGQWEQAETALKEALSETFGTNWAVNAGDGAFYGPKIDVRVTDALGRLHQCATIQLDFQLPIRFNLKYRDSKDQDQRPVIIHRAVLGSVERFLGSLLHCFLK